MTVSIEDIVLAVMADPDIPPESVSFITDVRYHPSGDAYVRVDLSPTIEAVVEATMRTLVSMGMIMEITDE